jgi:hypothetical protein
MFFFKLSQDAKGCKSRQFSILVRIRRELVAGYLQTIDEAWNKDLQCSVADVLTTDD